MKGWETYLIVSNNPLYNSIHKCLTRVFTNYRRWCLTAVRRCVWLPTFLTIVTNGLLWYSGCYQDIEFVTGVDPWWDVFTSEVIAQNRCTSWLVKRSDFDMWVNGVLLPYEISGGYATRVLFETYWQKTHLLCPSSSLKNIHTSSAFVFFFPSALRRGGRRVRRCVLCGPILGELWARFAARFKVWRQFEDIWRSGVWGVLSLESDPGLGDRNDSAPGDGGCEVWKGGAGEGAGENPGDMNGLRLGLSSALQDTLEVNVEWIKHLNDRKPNSFTHRYPLLPLWWEVLRWEHFPPLDSHQHPQFVLAGMRFWAAQEQWVG